MLQSVSKHELPRLVDSLFLGLSFCLSTFLYFFCESLGRVPFHVFGDVLTHRYDVLPLSFCLSLNTNEWLTEQRATIALTLTTKDPASDPQS